MTAIEAKVHLIESVAPDLSLVSATLDKMLVSIDGDYRNKLLEYRRVLADHEQRHGMTTAEFRRKFESGELGDDVEWFDWDGYAALAEEAEKKLAEVERGIA